MAAPPEPQGAGGPDKRVAQGLGTLVLDRPLARRVERYSATRLLGEVELPHTLREVKLYIDDPHRWYAGYLGVRGEVFPPFELRRDLSERVPQALLRDMLRPVMPDPSGRIEREPLPVLRSLGGEADGEGSPRAQVRLAMAELRQPLPEIIPSVVLIEEDRLLRQRLLKAPWQPWIPDDAPRQLSSNFGEGFSSA